MKVSIFGHIVRTAFRIVPQLAAVAELAWLLPASRLTKIYRQTN